MNVKKKIIYCVQETQGMQMLPQNTTELDDSYMIFDYIHMKMIILGVVYKMTQNLDKIKYKILLIR